MSDGASSYRKRYGSDARLPQLPDNDPQPDHHDIPIKRWASSDFTGSMIVGVHAYGDYSIAFESVAARLASFGHALLAFDQRGFGNAEASGCAPIGAYWSDLAAVVMEARRLARGRSVVVLAEGLGASVAISAVARDIAKPDALVLAGPVVRSDLVSRPVRPTPDAILEEARTEQLLSEAASARLLHDPLVTRHIDQDAYEHMIDIAKAALRDAGRIELPTLVLYGADDEIVSRATIDALMDELGTRGTLKTYHGRPHLVLQAERREDVENWTSCIFCPPCRTSEAERFTPSPWRRASSAARSRRHAHAARCGRR